MCEQKPELWAGIECTINRVGDQYFSQLERNGHLTRLEDLDSFAALGIKKIRYPVLWEQIAPGKLEDADWTWADERLDRLSQLNLCPIVGFTHHGSGPRHTSLVDPLFPEKLAQYAEAFAKRYPWVEYFTPVNEPLTTARFSGLYGHWYPHGRDNETFAMALVNQCKAIAQSMKAIRQHIPGAKLIQTEDICKICSTPLLAQQAAYENERRWLSLDLLCGNINDDHKMWGMLRSSGISRESLEWFLENPCSPDIVGLNHYLTSNRFLDENMDKYPLHYHGGNGVHNYADVEAVSVNIDDAPTIVTILREVWERYKIPIAITEAHLCATREEQLRWFGEFWNTAIGLSRQGIIVKAVTAWSLLGSFDWNSLVTRYNGFYESGVFDLRAPIPRPTAIAAMLSDLARNIEFKHPVLAMPGFWKRPQRLKWDKGESSKEIPVNILKAMQDGAAPVLILGATGTLGKAFARQCDWRCIPYRLLSRQELDITNSLDIADAIRLYKPWAVINAAGYVNVDKAEQAPELCFSANTYGPKLLAKACRDENIQLLTFSSDHVFDGYAGMPYLESDKPCPLNVYGQSKAEAEKQVSAIFPDALIVRASTFFSPWDEYNFIAAALRTIAAGEILNVPNDIHISPTYVPDLVDVCLDLLIDKESGIRHLVNDGAATWYELVKLSAEAAGLDWSLIKEHPSAMLPYRAPRPRNSVLSSEKGILLPTLTNALERYYQTIKIETNAI